MITNDIPEPGPMRNGMVAEVVGWVFDGDTDICWDEFLMRSPSTNEADALAALEIWCGADATRGYRIDRYSGEEVGYLVCLYATGSMKVIARAEAPTLPAAATAALLATREGV